MKGEFISFRPTEEVSEFLRLSKNRSRTINQALISYRNLTTENSEPYLEEQEEDTEEEEEGEEEDNEPSRDKSPPSSMEWPSF